MLMLKNSFASGHHVRWVRCTIVLGILLLASALRLWGAFSDLPYIYHPDEPNNIVVIQGMLSKFDPDPHTFLYPSLLYYINVVAAVLFDAIPTWISGKSPEFIEPLSIAMGSTYAPDAGAVALYRLVTISSGVLSVFLIYLIGKRARDVRTGLMAGLLAALSPLLAADCRHVTVDSYVVLFELLTILASLSIATSAGRSAYIAAGAAIGAAAASKYNGAVVCLFPVVAHFVRVGFAPRLSGPLLLAGVTSVLTFVVCSPYVLVDHQAFLSDLVYQFRTYSGYHQGMEGNAPVWYLRELWVDTGLGCLLAVCQIALAWRSRCVPTLILASFAIFYFLFISRFSLCNDRTLLPIVPCVLLLAAMFLTDLGSPQSVLRQISPGFRTALLFVLCVSVAVTPARITIAEAVQLTTIDARATSRQWINSELPPQAVVAVESYAPYVDPARFRIVESERAIDHAPAWYLAQGADYVVLSQGMFGRYFTSSGQYPEEAARYLQLMDSMQLVKDFHDGGYEVLVYKTLPPNTGDSR